MNIDMLDDVELLTIASSIAKKNPDKTNSEYLQQIKSTRLNGGRIKALAKEIIKKQLG